MTIRRVEPVRVNPLHVHEAEKRLRLDGDWQFRLDPRDAGVAEGWFARPGRLTERVAVPGCWQGQGFGSDAPQTIWDFNLTLRTFRAAYEGTGWYGREFTVPPVWSGRRLWLNFGGVHPSAEVWLNGQRLGENDLPFVPFGFEVTGLARVDAPNYLAVRVHEKNRLLGLVYNFQFRWSGLYRGVELTATGPAFLEQVALLPRADEHALRLRVRVGDRAAANAPAIRVAVRPAADAGAALIRAEFPVTADEAEFSLAVPAPRLWSPDQPSLYRVDVALVADGRVLDAQAERTGFVTLSGEGGRFLINGEPYFIRQSGDFVSCPETGCPDTDRERWRRKLRVLRAYGYNAVRCQSYVYTPEYFDIADEEGLLIQSEMGLLGAWGGTSPWHVYQWPKPTPDHYPALRRQWNAVVQRDVNHPSAILYGMSNEYGANTPFPRIAWRGYHETKAIKPHAWVIWTDGGFHEKLPGDFINTEPQKDKAPAKPLIVHEFRWWSSLPDARTLPKYAATAVRPYAVELAVETATRRGQAHLLPEATLASQKLQFLEAKAKMEMCRRDFPAIAGICHFDATDCSLSPQGIVDEFYELKYAPPELWLQTHGDAVVLPSLGLEDRVWRAGDTFACRLFVSDYAHPPLADPVLDWKAVAGDRVLASGSHAFGGGAYGTRLAGEVAFTVPPVDRALAARLEAVVRSGSRTVSNQWNVWFLPAAAGAWPGGLALYGPARETWLASLAGVPQVAGRDLAAGGAVRVALTERLDEPLVRWMRAGGRVILAASEGLVRPHNPLFGYVKYFFTPPANYAPYEDGQNAILVRNHPMLGDFPHEAFADLQFFRMIENAPPLDLEPLDLHGGEPAIRVIHRYQTFHPLAYLVERSLGQGGLILSALDLDPARAEGDYLLRQLAAYAAGPRFRPELALSDASLERLLDAGGLPAGDGS